VGGGTAGGGDELPATAIEKPLMSTPVEKRQ